MPSTQPLLESEFGSVLQFSNRFDEHRTEIIQYLRPLLVNQTQQQNTAPLCAVLAQLRGRQSQRFIGPLLNPDGGNAGEHHLGVECHRQRVKPLNHLPDVCPRDGACVLA